MRELTPNPRCFLRNAIYPDSSVKDFDALAGIVGNLNPYQGGFLWIRMLDGINDAVELKVVEGETLRDHAGEIQMALRINSGAISSFLTLCEDPALAFMDKFRINTPFELSSKEAKISRRSVGFRVFRGLDVAGMAGDHFGRL